jgi:hypothetical protein
LETGVFRSFCDDADLLEEREIVLQMPVVSNPSAADAENVGRNKVDAPSVTRPAHQAARKVAGESQMRHNAVSHYQALHYRQLEIRHCSKKCLGRLGWPGGSLRSPIGERVIDEISRDGFIKQLATAVHPKGVKSIDRFEELGNF